MATVEATNAVLHVPEPGAWRPVRCCLFFLCLLLGEGVVCAGVGAGVGAGGFGASVLVLRRAVSFALAFMILLRCSSVSADRSRMS